MSFRPPARLHRQLLASALTSLVFISTLGTAPDAVAHPLGNFTVNHYSGLVVHTDRLDAVAVVDRAEIPTAQERLSIDRDRNGTVAAIERSTHARAACTVLATEILVDADDHHIIWDLTAAEFSYQPGEAGLETSTLRCALTASVKLRFPATITLRTAHDDHRIGWHEITASGRGVKVADSNVPATSPTDELRHYPRDPLAEPLDQHSATLRVDAGASSLDAPVAAALPGAGAVTRFLNRAAAIFDSLVGTQDLTVPVGLLALFLAVLLGASHAAMPGHGKTLMAAYLAGRQGTPRDAVAVGATVTLTHTIGVLALGFVLPITTNLAGETVLRWLGIVSGVIVSAVGMWLLQGALRNRAAQPHLHHMHGHGHRYHHHDHAHEQADPLRSSQPRSVPTRSTGPDSAVGVLVKAVQPHRSTALPKASVSRSSVIGIGIAGGLVPSPSALVVLLGAIALGRTAFGVLLVVGYGLGMAATMTLAGLLLIKVRDRVQVGMRRDTQRRAWRQAASRIRPLATSTLVVLVGLGLIARTATGGL